MKIELNGKALIAILALSGSIVFADFVSIVDVESSGGVSIVSGVTESDIQDAIDDALPIGTIAMWGVSTLPSGWIEMNGQSITSYPELSSYYGSNLPDLRGEFVRGWDNGRGVDSGRSLSSTQLDQMQTIQGAMNVAGYYNSIASLISNFEGALYNSATTNNKTGVVFNTTASGRRSTEIGFDSSKSTGARTGDETRPRNVSLMYIIKAE